MLDYTTCCKLKAAGYPQNGATTRRDNWPAEIIPGVNGGRDEGLACPNSDELIAAIQQRFPGRLIEATHWPSGYTVINEVDPHTQQTADGPLIAGDNPAHAWANKYLALAGGDHG